MDQKRLVEAAEKSLQLEHFEGPAEISILLLGDEKIRELNRTYRGIDGPTDVLAFSQLEGEPVPPEGGPIPLGDVIVSVETAKRQAAESGNTLPDELDLLVIHGVLHLLGYDDETPEQAAHMRERERLITGQLRDERAT